MKILVEAKKVLKDAEFCEDCQVVGDDGTCYTTDQ